MTEFKITGRAGGKTYELLRAASILPDPEQCMIVTHSDHEAGRIRRLYMELYPGKPVPRFGIPSSAGMLGSGLNGPVFVDNTDIILADLIGRVVEYATATGTVTK